MTNRDARMVFDNAKAALVKAFGNEGILKIAKLTQGTLRFEAPLVANETLINFNILDNQTVNFITEDRLTLQDAFVVSSVKICTAVANSADFNANAFALDSYPNPTKYLGASGAALEAFYNATNMQIAVNNDIILPKWDVYRHRNSNQTQQTAALGAGSPLDQDRGASDGFYAMEPNVVLIGQKNTQFKIIYKGPGLSAVQANSRAIIMVRGVLAQNVTVVS